MSECIICGAADEPANGIVVAAVGELNEPTCNVCLADAKTDRTTLSRREAQVAALKQIGYSHARIAELLDVAKSTVDEYSTRLNTKRSEAEATFVALDF